MCVCAWVFIYTCHAAEALQSQKLVLSGLQELEHYGAGSEAWDFVCDGGTQVSFTSVSCLRPCQQTCRRAVVKQVGIRNTLQHFNGLLASRCSFCTHCRRDPPIWPDRRLVRCFGMQACSQEDGIGILRRGRAACHRDQHIDVGVEVISHEETPTCW